MKKRITPPESAFRFDAAATFDGAPSGQVGTVAGKFSDVAHSSDPIIRHWCGITRSFDRVMLSAARNTTPRRW